MNQEMTALLEDLPVRRVTSGEVLLEEGGMGKSLFFLEQAVIEVERKGVVIARESKKGAVFGEIAALLGVPHTATVRVAEGGTVRVAEDGAALLRQHPALALHLARILATRLQRVSGYLADLKRQYGDRDDSLAMVDEVIEALMERQTIGGSHAAPKAGGGRG